MCPHCQTPMYLSGTPDSWRCRTCRRHARTGESLESIEARHTQWQQAIALLDAALAASPRAAERERDRQITSEMEMQMGQTIQTRGCSKCGATMYRTVDVDDHGNPISMPQFVCNACGNVEG